MKSDEGAGGLGGQQDEPAWALAKKASAVMVEARNTYPAALAPCLEACRKAGVKCEYEGGWRADISEKASFWVEKTDKSARCSLRVIGANGLWPS